MLTRCPACATCYRVVADQLRVSKGWVRCGQCSEVFDAQANRLEQMAVSGNANSSVDAKTDIANDTSQRANPNPEPNPNQAASNQMAALEGLDAGAQSKQSESDRSGGGGSELQDEPEAAKETKDLQAVANNRARSFDTEHLAQSHVATETLVDTPGDVNIKTPNIFLDPMTPSAAQGADVMEPSWITDVDPEKLSFLRNEDVQASGRVRSILVWSVCIVVLFVGLIAQWTYQEHPRLMAQFPPARPALESACQMLGCQVTPVRDIDALVIDASSLTVAGQGMYRMNFTIRNQSAQSVTFPAFELTLIDELDQVLVRKVVKAEDLYTRKIESLGASQSTELSLGLEYKSSVNARRVVGYRLSTFYL